MELEFRESFLKDVKHIKEKGLKEKIAAVIADAKAADLLSMMRNVKKMESSDDYYRIRIGDYQIGIKTRGGTLVFLRCLRRKEIYRYFP